MYIYKFWHKFKVFFLCALALLSAKNPAFCAEEDLFTLSSVPSLTAPATPFRLSAKFDRGQASFTVTAPPTCYSYVEKISLKGREVSFTPPVLPPGVPHTDPLGSTEVIYGSFTLSTTILESKVDGELTLSMQGCDAQGVCYPPQSLTLRLPAYLKEGLTTLDAVPESSSSPADRTAREEGQPFTLLLCLVLGAGLVLTPCVLPMLSIYSAVLLGHRQPSLLRNLALNLSYLCGLSSTFALLGLLFARAGMAAQGFLQHPLVVALCSLMLLYCALDCMGVVSLRLPQGLINRVSLKMASYNQGTLRSAFLFGALSSLLATPCTSAPLAGALLYLLQSGDLIYGTLMFFMLGLGMGIPLVLVGLLGQHLLPKSGAFSELIHRLFALPLIYAAFYIAEHLFAPYETVASIVVLSLLAAYACFQILSLSRLTHILRLTCALTVLCLTLGAGLSVLPHRADPPFTVLRTVDDLKALHGQNLILTFSADWCHNCHALDRDLYASAAYRSLTRGFHTVRFDLSDPQSRASQELIEQFRLIGVPQLYVMNAEGRLSGGLSGLFSLNDLAELLNRVGGKKSAP